MIVRFRSRGIALAVAARRWPPSLPPQASSPKFFQAATQADFLKGDVENLSIDSRGQLVLGPATELVYERRRRSSGRSCPAPTARCSSAPGNDGRVFRVDAQGKGALFFDAAELEVHALAPAPDGGLYVGSSPDGKIYRVDRNGAATDVLRPGGEVHLGAGDRRKGNVYAGTGEKGDGLQDRARRQGRRFYQTKATHATALAFDTSGNLLVGTESPGRVLRVDARRQGLPAARHARFRRSARSGSTTRACCTSRPSAAGRRAGSAPPRRRPDDRPADAPRRAVQAAGRRRSPTEVTVDRRGRCLGRRQSGGDTARIAAAPRARSTASRRTACGTSSGSRATTRRTTSPSTPKAG